MLENMFAVLFPLGTGPICNRCTTTEIPHTQSNQPKNTSWNSCLAVNQQTTTATCGKCNIKRHNNKSCTTILSYHCFHKESILRHLQKFNNCIQRLHCLNDTSQFCINGEAALNLLAFVQLNRSIWVQSECWTDTLCHIEGKMPRVHTMGIYCHLLSR